MGGGTHIPSLKYFIILILKRVQSYFPPIIVFQRMCRSRLVYEGADFNITYYQPIKLINATYAISGTTPVCVFLFDMNMSTSFLVAILLKQVNMEGEWIFKLHHFLIIYISMFMRFFITIVMDWSQYTQFFKSNIGIFGLSPVWISWRWEMGGGEAWGGVDGNGDIFSIKNNFGVG